MEDFLGYALLHGMNAAGKLSARNSKGGKTKDPKPDVPKFFDYYYCHAAWMLGGKPFHRREQQGTAGGKRTSSTGGRFFEAQMIKFRSYGEKVWDIDCNRAHTLIWQYWKDQTTIPRNGLSRQDRYLLSKDLQQHQGGQSRGERISKDMVDRVKKICQDPNEPDTSDEDIDVGADGHLSIIPKRGQMEDEEDEEELERKRMREETRAEDQARAIALLCELDSHEFFNGFLSRYLQQLLFSLRSFKGVASELLAVETATTSTKPQIRGDRSTFTSTRQLHNVIATIEGIPPLATMLEHSRREYAQRIRNGASPVVAVSMLNPGAAVGGFFISPDLAAASGTTFVHAQQNTHPMQPINMHGSRNFVSLPPCSSELQSPSINALVAANPSSTSAFAAPGHPLLHLQPQQHLMPHQSVQGHIRTSIGEMPSPALVAQHPASLLAGSSGMFINDPNARRRRAEVRKSARSSTGSNPNVVHKTAQMFSPPAEQRVGRSTNVVAPPVPKARGRPKAKAAHAKKRPSGKGKSKGSGVRKSTAPKYKGQNGMKRKKNKKSSLVDDEDSEDSDIVLLGDEAVEEHDDDVYMPRTSKRQQQQQPQPHLLAAQRRTRTSRMIGQPQVAQQLQQPELLSLQMTNLQMQQHGLDAQASPIITPGGGSVASNIGGMAASFQQLGDPMTRRTSSRSGASSGNPFSHNSSGVVDDDDHIRSNLSGSSSSDYQLPDLATPSLAQGTPRITSLTSALNGVVGGVSSRALFHQLPGQQHLQMMAGQQQHALHNHAGGYHQQQQHHLTRVRSVGPHTVQLQQQQVIPHPVQQIQQVGQGGISSSSHGLGLPQHVRTPPASSLFALQSRASASALTSRQRGMQKSIAEQDAGGISRITSPRFDPAHPPDGKKNRAATGSTNPKQFLQAGVGKGAVGSTANSLNSTEGLSGGGGEGKRGIQPQTSNGTNGSTAGTKKGAAASTASATAVRSASVTATSTSNHVEVNGGGASSASSSNTKTTMSAGLVPAHMAPLTPPALNLTRSRAASGGVAEGGANPAGGARRPQRSAFDKTSSIFDAKAQKNLQHWQRRT
ncbi:unnamed protein product [Amoebophrya sp. A25]|nr:unnamed protein product [Amoebophrya sp. A25]|eukprot:GSA25T00001826001.1